MLGFASSYSEPASVDFVHISTNNYNLYAMDDWRVSNRLTLNLGIRWEGLPHAYDSESTASNFYPNLYDPKQAATFLPSGALDTNGPGFTTVSGIVLSNVKFYLNGIGIAGRNGIPQGLVDNHWNTFAPRIGFAYRFDRDARRPFCAAEPGSSMNGSAATKSTTWAKTTFRSLISPPRPTCTSTIPRPAIPADKRLLRRTFPPA